MKEYVFYTFEGYTESPTGKEVENIQLLGFESGKNKEEAKRNLIKKRGWIVENGFDEHQIESKQLLSDKEKELIKKLIDYNWAEEKKHYEEAPVQNHIFLILKQLKKLI